MHPGPLTLKNPIPEGLAALGREVLEVVPRKQRGSLEAYRQAGNDLSRILKTTGARVTPKKLYYAALRVKWLQEQGSEQVGPRLSSTGAPRQHRRRQRRSP